jgi:hypothetical protein
MSFKQEGTWTRNLSQKAWKMKWVFGLRGKREGGRVNKEKKKEDRLFKTSVPPVLYTKRVGCSLNVR